MLRINRVLFLFPLILINHFAHAALPTCKVSTVSGSHKNEFASGELKREGWVSKLDTTTRVSITGELKLSKFTYEEFGGTVPDYLLRYTYSCDLSLNCTVEKSLRENGKTKYVGMTVQPNNHDTRALKGKREFIRFERTVHGFSYFFIQDFNKNGEENGVEVNCEP